MKKIENKSSELFTVPEGNYLKDFYQSTRSELIAIICKTSFKIRINQDANVFYLQKRFIEESIKVQMSFWFKNKQIILGKEVKSSKNLGHDIYDESVPLIDFYDLSRSALIGLIYDTDLDVKPKIEHTTEDIRNLIIINVIERRWRLCRMLS